MAGAAAGDPDAIDELVRRHWRSAYVVANSICRDPGTAEEVAQDALVKAIGSMSRFRRDRRFEPWLHRIVANAAIDRVRAGARMPLPVDAVPDVAPGSGDASLSAPLADALDALPPEERAIVVLRHVLDYRSAEIGRMLGIPAGSVRRRLAAAMAGLRSTLDEGGAA